MLKDKVAKILHREEEIYHSINAWDKLTTLEKESFLIASDKILLLIKSELDKLTVIDDDVAKEEVLKYHCSPETTKRDIVITDIECDLITRQLQHTKKQLLDLMGF